ncbi:unnamed protein product [Polarella glacialis]|uniref:Uncharacterized protein n=1 Tax=Polarella glacialis TaxID=89957 RepID=A0A813J7J3_POLGL|nr:unnamed protein product [Polarella glacialis]
MRCCASLGALGLLAKDDPLLTMKIADSLLDITQSHSVHEDVLHVGVTVLLALYKDCVQICCLYCRPVPLISLRNGHPDTIATHIRATVPVLVSTCQTRSQLSNEMLNQFYKLLAHAHSLKR